MTSFDSPYRRLKVTDDHGVRLLKFDRNRQSSMRIDDPFHTDIEYIAYLHVAVAVRPDPRKALVIGLGGGSVVKQLWRDHPALHIDAVEIDPEVIEVARALFAVPEDRVDIYQGDGRLALGVLADDYDIAIIDAFDDDHVPRHLTTEEFMRELKSVTTDRSAIAYNVFGAAYGPHSKTFRSMYRTARNVWRNVWVFPIGLALDPGDDTRNIVLVASDIELTVEELLGQIETRADGVITCSGFERAADDLYRGPIRSGDVPMLVDHPARRRR